MSCNLFGQEYFYSDGDKKSYVNVVSNEWLVYFDDDLSEVELGESYQQLIGNYYRTTDTSGIHELNLVYHVSRALKYGMEHDPFYESSEIVLCFKNSTSQSLRNTLISQYNLSLIKQEGFYARYRSNQALADAADIYETGLVHFAHPNFMVKGQLASYPPIIPNDTYFDKQYYIHNTGQIINDNDAGVVDADMDVAEAWNITLGDSNLVIAVIDEGVSDDNPDLPLSRQVRLPGGNVAAPFYDTNKVDDLNPNSLHGEKCAGIIAATQGNNLGISGIAPKTKIMPVKIIGNVAYLNLTVYSNAFKFADNNGARIISGSFNITGNPVAPPYPVIDSAIDAAVVNDRILCLSAGNTRNQTSNLPGGGSQADTIVLYPATTNNESIICVGASDKKNRQAEYSPLSHHIDVVAPSSTSISTSDSLSVTKGFLDVWTLGNNNFTGGTGLPQHSLPNSGPDSNRFTGRFGGTSAATPMVAGVAALVVSANPCLSSLEVKNILCQTADKIGPYNYNWSSKKPGHSLQLGYGKVNALQAVLAAEAMNSATLDLMVKDVPRDFGYEPDTIAKHLYISEDIWVRNSADGFVNQYHENPKYQANTPVYVYVRIKNKSCVDATGGDSLKLYWSKAATALSWPNHWDGSMTNPLVMGAPVGFQDIDTLVAGHEKILQFTWQPPNPDDYTGIIPQDWHFCLLARIESSVDTMAAPEDSTLWKNVKNNNNIAWKNITVAKTKNNVAAEPALGIGGTVAIGSPTEEPTTIDLKFMPEENEFGNPLLEDAEIKIKLDDLALSIWEDGESQSEGMDYLGDGLFEVSNENAVLKNMSFQGNERATIHVGFNMLTEEVGEKVVYRYYVEQFEILEEGEEFVGGEQFFIHRDDRNLFTANAGNDEEVEVGQTVQLQANLIGEAATYNWYNEEGELVYSGTDTTFVPTENTIYTLEVIAHADGFKDYDEKKVEIKEYFIESIYPNPTNNQNNLTIDYEVSTASSAYLVITNTLNNQTYNYILNLTNNSISIPTSNYTVGTYQVYLVCNGSIQDAQTITIY